MGPGGLSRGWRREGRHTGLRYLALRYLGLGLVVLFVAFELCHPVADLLHYDSHRHTLACNGSTQGTPAGESASLDSHGPFLLVPTPQLRPPSSRWRTLRSNDPSPESPCRALPDPVPIVG